MELQPRRGTEGTAITGRLCPPSGPVSFVVAFVFGAALCVSVGGCAHPQARTIAAAPDVPLDVPAPPPRAVEPITADALPVVGPVTEPARGTAPRQQRPPTPTQTSGRGDAPRADAPRAEPPVADPPRPADDAAARTAPAPSAATTPTLQTTPVQQEREFEARIRTQLSRATNDLSRVDYRRLNNGAKGQYDSAKSYVSQSEDAIRAKNLPFAQALADKAADIAALLAGR
jgi:hypothetical protein